MVLVMGFRGDLSKQNFGQVKKHIFMNMYMESGSEEPDKRNSFLNKQVWSHKSHSYAGEVIVYPPEDTTLYWERTVCC